MKGGYVSTMNMTNNWLVKGVSSIQVHLELDALEVPRLVKRIECRIGRP